MRDAHTFEVLSRREGHRSIVIPDGEIDLATVGQLRDEIDRLLHGGRRDVLVDLSLVTFMDAAGLHLLLDARDAFSAVGGNLSIGGISEPVRRLLQVTGMCGMTRSGRSQPMGD